MQSGHAGKPSGPSPHNPFVRNADAAKHLPPQAAFPRSDPIYQAPPSSVPPSKATSPTDFDGVFGFGPQSPTPAPVPVPASSPLTQQHQVQEHLQDEGQGSLPKNPPNAPPTLPPPPFRKGEMVDQGRIRIISFVGQGSFAHVYKAYDSLSSTHCAVKCLLKAGLDPNRRNAQKKEVHAMEDLSGHPNIVRLIRVVESGDWMLIVMEFCEIDLYDTIMQKGGLPDHAVKDVFNQLCDAVLHCHARGYFHRDIKPENCLIDVSTFTVKLTDFGLATRDTWSYEMGCGSSRYICPEGCLTANPRAGYSPAASDIWALGIILINLLFSKNPWFEATPNDPIFSQFVGPRPDILRHHFGVSIDLDNVLQRVFALDPAKRIPLPEFKLLINGMAKFLDDPAPTSIPQAPKPAPFGIAAAETAATVAPAPAQAVDPKTAQPLTETSTKREGPLVKLDNALPQVAVLHHSNPFNARHQPVLNRQSTTSDVSVIIDARPMSSRLASSQEYNTANVIVTGQSYQHVLMDPFTDEIFSDSDDSEYHGDDGADEKSVDEDDDIDGNGDAFEDATSVLEEEKDQSQLSNVDDFGIRQETPVTSPLAYETHAQSGAVHPVHSRRAHRPDPAGPSPPPVTIPMPSSESVQLTFIWPAPSRAAATNLPYNLALGREGIGRIGISRIAQSRPDKPGSRRNPHGPSRKSGNGRRSRLNGNEGANGARQGGGLLGDSDDDFFLDDDSDDSDADGHWKLPDEESHFEAVRVDKRLLPDLERGLKHAVRRGMRFRNFMSLSSNNNASNAKAGGSTNEISLRKDDAGSVTLEAWELGGRLPGGVPGGNSSQDDDGLLSLPRHVKDLKDKDVEGSSSTVPNTSKNVFTDLVYQGLAGMGLFGAGGAADDAKRSRDDEDNLMQLPAGGILPQHVPRNLAAKSVVSNSMPLLSTILPPPEPSIAVAAASVENHATEADFEKLIVDGRDSFSGGRQDVPAATGAAPSLSTLAGSSGSLTRHRHRRRGHTEELYASLDFPPTANDPSGSIRQFAPNNQFTGGPLSNSQADVQPASSSNPFLKSNQATAERRKVLSPSGALNSTSAAPSLAAFSNPFKNDGINPVVVHTQTVKTGGAPSALRTSPPVPGYNSKVATSGLRHSSSSSIASSLNSDDSPPRPSASDPTISSRAEASSPSVSHVRKKSVGDLVQAAANISIKALGRSQTAGSSRRRYPWSNSRADDLPPPVPSYQMPLAADPSDDDLSERTQNVLNTSPQRLDSRHSQTKRTRQSSRGRKKGYHQQLADDEDTNRADSDSDEASIASGLSSRQDSPSRVTGLRRKSSGLGRRSPAGSLLSPTTLERWGVSSGANRSPRDSVDGETAKGARRSGQGDDGAQLEDELGDDGGDPFGDAIEDDGDQDSRSGRRFGARTLVRGAFEALRGFVRGSGAAAGGGAGSESGSFSRGV
ncbi:hypothetical protein DFJ73DRAFT_643151 [Zopfochytrium polystomum]|nr:hypothetical protein DFJ73DRAFT_643151 [Zopfochytrium polystomum]